MIVNNTIKLIVTAVAIATAVFYWAYSSSTQTQDSSEHSITTEESKSSGLPVKTANEASKAIIDNFLLVSALSPYNENIADEERAQRDKDFMDRINDFKEPVNVEIKQTHGKTDGEVYFYFYVINTQGVDTFGLDLNCPDVATKEASVFNVAGDPIQKNTPGKFSSSHTMSWFLKSDVEGPQAMWFYSMQPPVKRQYRLYMETGSKLAMKQLEDGSFISVGGGGVGELRKGFIEGPACPEAS